MGKLPAGSPTKNHHVLSIEDNSVHALEAHRKVRKKSSGRFQDAGKTGSRVGTPPPTTNRGSHRILAGEEKSSEHSCFAGFLLAEDRGFEPPRAFTQDAFQACNVGKQLDSQISCEIGPLVELQALPAGNWNVPVIHSRDIFVNLSVTSAFEAILDCRPIPTEIVLYRNGIEPIPGEIERPK